MSDPDTTPTRPLPESGDASEAVTEPLAPHVPFAAAEAAPMPASPPSVKQHNWAWVPIAAVLVAVAVMGVVLASIGVFNQDTAPPLVETPTQAPVVTPSAPAENEGTVTEPEAPPPPPAPEPTEPAPEPTEPQPEPTEPAPTPEPTP